VACVYNGADSKDDTGTFLDVLARARLDQAGSRAYAASRAYRLPLHSSLRRSVKDRMTGHSRNGKMSSWPPP